VLAAAAAAEVPIYPVYANPSVYTYPAAYSPPLVYSEQPVAETVVQPVVPAATETKVDIAAIEKVFGFMAKFITELKANIPADAVPPVNIPPVNIPSGAIPAGAIPAGAIPAGAIPAGAIPAGAAAYASAVPVNYQPKDVKIEEIEAIFGLLKNFTTTLLSKPTQEVPSAEATTPEAETVVKTKRSPQEYIVQPYPSAYPVNYNAVEPAVTENKPSTETIEKVFGFMSKFITELKANIPEGSVPPTNIPGVPAAYQPKEVKVEEIEAVFGLLKKFTTTLLSKPTQEAPAADATAPEEGNVVKTKRSPQEYNVQPYPSAYPVNYNAIQPAVTENKPPTEAIEKVFGFMTKFISELKANIPADGIPPTNIPGVPAAYQPKEVKIEELEAVFGLLKKFTTQLLANPAALGAAAPAEAAPAEAAPAEAAPAEAAPAEAAPAEAAPSEAAPVEEAPAETYQLINTGCYNNVGVSVPCALKKKRSPQEIVAVPVAYNTVPVTYVAQPLTSTYPVATPVTYQGSEPAVTENKPKIEDIEKVFNFMTKFISELKANIPADAVEIPPVNIPPVNIPPVNIPSVTIPPVNIPNVVVPSVVIPAGAVPAGTVPTGAISVY
jgi:hypothetical protein